ncbi:dihydropteroate synthase [Virgibacillus sp. W0181]|uniref:dihydropteroate synthase n=1 Tax=Virgibacillus sp. W0181 TaxID=3391581 RepID=UPI003F46244E
MLLKTKKQTYDLQTNTHIMGILNVTPDSFSDGGKFISQDEAIKQAVLMEKQGAHMIDVGGESTRPGHEPVAANEELDRVIPVIKAIREKVNVPISIDTYRAETARQAIEAGADIINDIWGAKKDPEMAAVAAEFQVPIILMHNRTNKQYGSLLEDMKNDLRKSVEIALNAGVAKDNIILDPGIGFAKTVEHNFLVMNELEKISALGFPLLLGASRKSFIGHVLDVPADARDNGTGATTCLGIVKGANIVRVHDVKMNVELVKMMDAMLKRGKLNTKWIK